MPARPKVGAQIRRARQLLDMRQQDLADKLGVSRNTVDSWEHDRSYPQRKLARLEQVLGISLDAAPEPEPELVPRNEWEAATLADPDLPDEIKRAFVIEWRAARAAYKTQVAQERESARSEARRQAAG